jgi:FKBP12-rapamycin complex-associated protein
MLQVPFRLTRMLVRAMEVSGIEGNFRSTCENVVQVLRTHMDSVMAMMQVCHINSSVDVFQFKNERGYANCGVSLLRANAYDEFQAFVHDPLINWRLFNMNEVPQMGTLASTRTLTTDGCSALQDPASPVQRGFREREVMQVWSICSGFYCKDLI